MIVKIIFIIIGFLFIIGGFKYTEEFHKRKMSQAYIMADNSSDSIIGTILVIIGGFILRSLPWYILKSLLLVSGLGIILLAIFVI
jgi:hypothetical protein